MSTMQTEAAERPSGTPLAVEVAANVRAAAARAYLTRADVARLFGRSRQWVNDRWTGRYSWTVHEVELLAEALDIPPAALLEADR